MEGTESTENITDGGGDEGLLSVPRSGHAADVNGGTVTDAPTEEHLYAGKYKSIEELERGYGELYGRFTQGRPTAPEAYDTGIFDEAGLRMDGHDDAWTEMQDQLRDAEVSEDQFPVIARMGGQMLENQRVAIEGEYQQLLDEHGVATDINTELDRLRETWGEKTETNIAAVKQWAETNLDPEVVKLFRRNASGVRFIHDLMNGRRGPVPTANRETEVDVTDLQVRIREAIASDDYRNNPAKQAQVAQWIERVQRAQARNT